MTPRFLTLTSAIALMAGPAFADMNFNRIASFAIAENAPEAEETSAEIIAVTGDGMTLVYTDSPLEALGFIDITDPTNPAPAGIMELEGEPTSVAVAGNYALAGVNTSESYTNPSGYLVEINIADQSEVDRCDLPGQPDSVAIAPDASFLAVAIENERDEDLGDGRVGQLPGGSVVMVDLTPEGLIDCDTLRVADVTGLADVAPEDPEPEYVHINGEGEVVVTLQENNHMVVLNSAGEVQSHFSAGAVDLEGIDVDEERAFVYNGSQPGRVREPDAVTWIDDTHFATANEGDMDGGSRGWTIFHQDGTVVYESGTSFEEAIIQIGHYPERRSGNKGVEPESVTFAEFGGTPMVFVGAERASVVGVYDVTDPANPALLQLLPSGIGPEGYVTIPSRNLLVSANEVDGLEDGAARAHVMLFEYQEAAASYPHLTSASMEALTGWGAISGQVADADGMIYAVNDSFYAMQPTIFVIDPSQTPAQIVDAIRVTRAGQPAQLLDMEGITLDGEGGFWIASEGRTDRLVPHALYHVGADGEIEDYVPLPAELQAVERRFGFEGITMVGDTLWMAVQRPWDDDPENHTKLVSYNLETEAWGAVHYPLTEPATGWVGLSEIVAHGDYVYVIERDNQIGAAAVTKQITRIPLAQMVPGELGGDLPVVEPELVVDLLPYLTSTGGFVLDKVEGLAIMDDGTMWVSTDNDGVDDHSGETMFFALPPM
ncbi:alkaline phosphatase [Roseobacter sp. HKCCD9010]|uniref:esterase-like activity of phytase family protein n=1 Tax=unclassified Roseobacter TaxID=196798 RepID=UPI001491C1F7|nr:MULTISPECIES: esterase-like activity of phytase family protein [unclassified Roseobacter]MBF9048984.1 alkaline phosphatase [Rhodobacterales bacterium HKCCD4356]NNV10983.1 alkaline phosphatase [Roseobacter sp. HKCCD7357]NNV15168.1 alkaline phosphatase [Roseobacter sp. HKCCD8768]NNV24627.1 alkaline phosphatase [Roseobacter sp. HKCCD8192]NNV28884.1 alkaline phosphatase [Roseobacter sp. HKCCD9061]